MHKLGLFNFWKRYVLLIGGSGTVGLSPERNKD